MYPRHRKHGGENGTALGGRVSLEPATKNLVEVCRIGERAVLGGAALSIFVLITGGNGWTKRPEIRERKGYWKSSAVDWNGTRNAKRRSGLATVPDMSDCPTLPGCWTVQGRHWLPNSAQLNGEILPKLSNTSCFSNGALVREGCPSGSHGIWSLPPVSTGN